MIKWDDVLSEETGKELDSRIARSVQGELEQFRAQRRRAWLAWFVPATMGALGAAVWWQSKPLSDELPQQDDEGLGDAAVQAVFEGVDVDEELFTILEEFELLENLEVLEQWNS
jgi:hypothetical protein